MYIYEGRKPFVIRTRRTSFKCRRGTFVFNIEANFRWKRARARNRFATSLAEYTSAAIRLPNDRDSARQIRRRLRTWPSDAAPVSFYALPVGNRRPALSVSRETRNIPRSKTVVISVSRARYSRTSRSVTGRAVVIINRAPPSVPVTARGSFKTLRSFYRRAQSGKVLHDYTTYRLGERDRKCTYSFSASYRTIRFSVVVFSLIPSSS